MSPVTAAELKTGDVVWHDKVLCTIITAVPTKNRCVRVSWSEPYPDRPRTVLVTTGTFWPNAVFGTRT